MSRKTIRAGIPRNKRRTNTKSSVRITCQRQTTGARNRARKSMRGKMRIDEDKLATQKIMRRIFGDESKSERFKGAHKADRDLNALIAYSNSDIDLNKYGEITSL